MLWPLVYLWLAVLPSRAIEVVYESTQQLMGFDVLGSTLRVRKYNRTTTVLNGSFTFNVDIDDSFVVHTDFYHSRLGNQQFNHYPMKLPTRGMCRFIQDFGENYPEISRTIVNFPKGPECPVTARVFHIFNQVFPSKAIPPTFPTGLWKAMLSTRVNGVERISFELVLKAYNDIFF